MTSNEKQIYSFLGLANRAGKVVSGEDTTLNELRRNRVKLVVIATDASENTKKLFKDKSSFRKVPHVFFSDKATLGYAIGKSPRAVIGIKDANFKERIYSLIQSEKI